MTHLFREGGWEYWRWRDAAEGCGPAGTPKKSHTKKATRARASFWALQPRGHLFQRAYQSQYISTFFLPFGAFLLAEIVVFFMELPTLTGGEFSVDKKLRGK